MKTIRRSLTSLALCAALFLPATLHAAATTPPAKPFAALVIDTAPDTAYSAGSIALSPFASYRTHEIGKFNGKFGGGLALSWFAADNIAIEVETLSERFDDSHWIGSLAEAGVNFKGYLPLNKFAHIEVPLAPYGFIGYTRNLQIDENRMNAGAGLDWKLGKHASLFLDGRWTHDFSVVGHGLFRLGGNLTF